MHPFDLANLVAGDHRLAETLFRRIESGAGDRSVLFHQVITNVALHAGAEEQVFYPALRDLGKDDWADADLAEHQPVKEALVELDRHEPGTDEAERAMRVVIDAVREHARHEELEQLPWLRDQVGSAMMVELGEAFVVQQRRAPTHAHPHAPSSPVVATPAALVDKVRDRFAGRDLEVATDASGLLDPQAQELVDTFASLGVTPPHLLDADAARRQPTIVDAVTALAGRIGGDRGPAIEPTPMELVQDHRVPGPAGELTLRVYQPSFTMAAGSRLPVLVYVHGGGWVLADLDAYDASCRALAGQAGCIVASVAYRHAPEHPFPAAHDDVLAATRWVMAHADELGGDPARVAIGGESAGGNMAAATCLTLLAAGERLPVFQLLVYPVTSTSMDQPSYAEAADAKPLYAGLMNWFLGQTIATADDLHDPRLDLLSNPVDRLAGLPPALVITAGRDPLRDEGETWVEHLRRAGVDVEHTRYEGMMHEFFGAGLVLDQAVVAQAQAARALRIAFGATTVGRVAS